MDRAVRLVAAPLVTVLTIAVLSVPSVRDVTPSAVPPAPSTGRAAAVEAPVLPVPQAVPVPKSGSLPEPVVPVQPGTVEPPAPALPVEARPAPLERPLPPDLEQRGRDALDGLRYPWEELGFSVRFEAWRGGNLLGVTDYDDRTITVFMRPGQSELSLRATLAHEIGHALDFVTGSEQQRSRYLELRGVDPRMPWFPCDGCSDYASPAGDWAEVFALWLVGPGDFRSELAGEPDAATLREIARLFAPPSY
ncbi:MAG TPA: hypothetical protein VM433_12900, partial [Mycobacteriales bacterium]|nr:hypothetical protein [Mycobacteriales bacterium]